MGSAVSLAVIFLAAGCSVGDLAAPVVNPGAPAAFRVSSLESSFFAVVGTFEGTYTIEPDGLNVFIRRATVRVRDMGFYAGPRHISTLRVGLGYGDRRDRWGMQTRSEPVRIDRVLSPGDEITLDSMHVWVPDARTGEELRRSWIIFEMEETQTGENGRTPGPGWAYAHGLRLDGSAP
jgi:hypothetical protein